MFLGRGYAFTHEAVREWEERFAPLISAQLKAKRRGQAGKSRYVDEMYVKINEQWICIGPLTGREIWSIRC